MDFPGDQEGLALGWRVTEAWRARARGGDEEGTGGGEGEFGELGKDGEACIAEVDGAVFLEGFLAVGRGVQVERVAALAVGDERAPAGLHDVGAHGGPAGGVVDGLEALFAAPVPDLEGVTEACGDGDQVRGLRQDRVTADKVLSRPSLSGRVGGDLDVVLHFAAANRPYLDDVVAMLAGKGRCCGGDVKEVDGWVFGRFLLRLQLLPRNEVDRRGTVQRLGLYEAIAEWRWWWEYNGGARRFSAAGCGHSFYRAPSRRL